MLINRFFCFQLSVETFTNRNLMQKANFYFWEKISARNAWIFSRIWREQNELLANVA